MCVAGDLVHMGTHTTEKPDRWLLPPDTKGFSPPGLYLVATPIGNLGDITLRALDILASCDVIACEDTRVTARLLSHYGIKKPLSPLHDHNESGQTPGLLARIGDGARVVLVSDAGTPLVSDPGYKLVQAALARGLYVTAIPGANAPLAALQLSGLPSDKFVFAGFLPPRQKACRDALVSWLDTPATLIAFETAPRLLKTLGILAELAPARPLAVARELTKLHESVKSGTAAELLAFYEQEEPRGEIVLLIGPAPAQDDWSEDALSAALRAAMETMSLREAVDAVAARAGAKRKAVYNLALKIGGRE